MTLHTIGGRHAAQKQVVTAAPCLAAAKHHKGIIEAHQRVIKTCQNINKHQSASFLWDVKHVRMILHLVGGRHVAQKMSNDSCTLRGSSEASQEHHQNMPKHHQNMPKHQLTSSSIIAVRSEACQDGSSSHRRERHVPQKMNEDSHTLSRREF